MIRKATENDLQSILEIYNEAILHTTAVYDYKPYSFDNRKQWFREKEEAELPVIVLEDDGEVVGFATYGPFRSRPAYKYTVEHSVYIKRSHSGNGRGKTLLKEIITVAEQNGYKMMVAGIDAANEGSIKLHQKLGFEHVGTVKYAAYKFGRWLDLAFYQLELPGPDEPIEE
ncbi:GNAT family N-acetyltransferase [Aquisalibacillus elongatus]|uniref:Phosphinothricin acetyltransferase n=1 Tax=Aquisalibacillus elongatus TaxID=485577 RepID=A0A3N5C9K4_9BACI|nr:GNAT family N-acetyltransferase [Aquisalibacillus elongatus]RPF53331.1 phosphinothricin acetyltransferase [Aquisalibacillus elongatus]